MKRMPRAPYNQVVGRYILFLLCWVIISGARASADPQDIATTNAPVFFAQLKDGGNVTIHTWGRNDVQIDGDPSLTIHHLPAAAIARRGIQQFNFWNQTVDTPEGQLSIPREPFDAPPLDSQPHDGIVVLGGGDVSVTVPVGTPLIVVNTTRGNVSIDNYHNGTIVSHIGAGSLHLQNVSGTVGAQLGAGPFIAQNSQFDRIRVRNARGQILFDNCNAKQIEATSLLGNIVYDRGSFDPGLARFESQRGNIALGVARGGAQVDAHSGSGQVLTEGNVRGGPVVTATSAAGNVMVYNGALAEHPSFREQLSLGRPRIAPETPRQGQRTQQRTFPRKVQRHPRPVPTFHP